MLLVAACRETCEVIIVLYINFIAMNCDVNVIKCSASQKILGAF